MSKVTPLIRDRINYSFNAMPGSEVLRVPPLAAFLPVFLLIANHDQVLCVFTVQHQ